MSYIDFIDPLGSKLIEKHNCIQNLNIFENPILALYTFSWDFSLFGQKIMSKETLSWNKKSKNHHIQIVLKVEQICLVPIFGEVLFIFDIFNTFIRKPDRHQKNMVMSPRDILHQTTQVNMFSLHPIEVKETPISIQSVNIRAWWAWKFGVLVKMRKFQ